MADATREQPVNKVVVSTPWDLPGQLDAGVPGIKHLVSHAISQLPCLKSSLYTKNGVKIWISQKDIQYAFHTEGVIVKILAVDHRTIKICQLFDKNSVYLDACKLTIFWLNSWGGLVIIVILCF